MQNLISENLMMAGDCLLNTFEIDQKATSSRYVGIIIRTYSFVWDYELRVSSFATFVGDR